MYQWPSAGGLTSQFTKSWACVSLESNVSRFVPVKSSVGWARPLQAVRNLQGFMCLNIAMAIPNVGLGMS
jgi:hypothetical protein